MPKNKKLLTIDDLYQFCLTRNKSFSFNVEQEGYQLVVQVPGLFEEVSDSSTEGLMPVRLKVCHCGKNRNQSMITEENMKKAIPSLKYRPILGDIEEIEDGVYDFTSHKIEFKKDGSPYYIERVIGVFANTENARLEYDEEKEKNYLVSDAVIYEDYGNQACDIIRRKDGTKVSCEICVNSMSYDNNEKAVNITDFIFLGCTCLGTDPETGDPVEEGMEGSELTLADFSAKNNSQFSQGIDIKKYLVEIISELKKANGSFSGSEKFNIDILEKGGETLKLNELKEKYNVTDDDITFETDGLSDEELEAKFEEEFGCKKKKGCAKEDETQEEPKDEDGEKKENAKKKKCSLNEFGDATITYEISHEDVRSALFNLLYESDEDNCCYYCIIEVYDSHFIVQDYSTGTFFKQGYLVENENVSLVNNRTEVYMSFLTKEEKDALELQKHNYEELKKFKDAYDKEAKEQVLGDKNYSEIKESDEFKELIKNIDSFSVQELTREADLLFAQSKKVKFEKQPLQVDSGRKSHKKNKPYGDLFD